MQSSGVMAQAAAAPHGRRAPLAALLLLLLAAAVGGAGAAKFSVSARASRRARRAARACRAGRRPPDAANHRPRTSRRRSAAAAQTQVSAKGQGAYAGFKGSLTITVNQKTRRAPARAPAPPSERAPARGGRNGRALSRVRWAPAHNAHARRSRRARAAT
jgi:hypothetical protein